MGSRRSLKDGITLTVGQVASINISLRPGNVSETITITADADLINSTTAQISQVINEHSVKELPLNGRDPAEPGTAYDGHQQRIARGWKNAGIASFGNESLPNETGRRPQAVEDKEAPITCWMGPPNMDTYMLLAAPFPNADATSGGFASSQITSMRSMDFLQEPVVSIATKSGTNAFHGGVFEFIRNNAFQRLKLLYPHSRSPQNETSSVGYLGGPIIKDKLFFFGNYQATRERAHKPQQTSTFTPTQAMLNGDFSAVPLVLGGPFTTIAGKAQSGRPSLVQPWEQ